MVIVVLRIGCPIAYLLAWLSQVLGKCQGAGRAIKTHHQGRAAPMVPFEEDSRVVTLHFETPVLD